MPNILHPRYPMPEEALAMAELLSMAFTMQFSERGWHLVDLQGYPHNPMITTLGVNSEHVIEVPFDMARDEYKWREAINIMLERRRKRREE